MEQFKKINNNIKLTINSLKFKFEKKIYIKRLIMEIMLFRNFF